jgi:hypothetical protein
MYRRAQSITVNTLHNFSVKEIDSACMKNGFEQLIKLREKVTFCSVNDNYSLEDIAKLLESIRFLHDDLNEDNLIFTINF